MQETLLGCSSFLLYKSLNVWVGTSGFATSDNIENATMYFKVDKSWTQDKNIDQSSITLNMYNDSKWDQLSTSLSGEDDKYLYFTAETPGFSSFAITGKAAATEAVNEIQSEPDTQGPEQNNGSATNAEQTPEQTQSSNSSENGSTNAPGFEMIYGIIGLLGVSLYRRR